MHSRALVTAAALLLAAVTCGDDGTGPSGPIIGKVGFGGTPPAEEMWTVASDGSDAKRITQGTSLRSPIAAVTARSPRR